MAQLLVVINNRIRNIDSLIRSPPIITGGLYSFHHIDPFCHKNRHGSVKLLSSADQHLVEAAVDHEHPQAQKHASQHPDNHDPELPVNSRSPLGQRHGLSRVVEVIHVACSHIICQIFQAGSCNHLPVDRIRCIHHAEPRPQWVCQSLKGNIDICTKHRPDQAEDHQSPQAVPYIGTDFILQYQAQEHNCQNQCGG